MHTAGVMNARWLLSRAGKFGQSCCVARASPGRVVSDPYSIPTAASIVIPVKLKIDYAKRGRI